MNRHPIYQEGVVDRQTQFFDSSVMSRWKFDKANAYTFSPVRVKQGQSIEDTKESESGLEDGRTLDDWSVHKSLNKEHRSFFSWNVERKQVSSDPQCDKQWQAEEPKKITNHEDITK